MSKAAELKKLERGSNVVFKLTDGTTEKGTVHRLIKRGGVLAAIGITNNGNTARVKVPNIKSLIIKGKSKTMAIPKKKGKKAAGKSATKTRVSKKVAKKKATKKVEKGGSKVDIKAAKAELKVAAAEAKRAATALKKAAINFVKAQKLPKGERVDLMDVIKESAAVIKESMSDFKAADLKPE